MAKLKKVLAILEDGETMEIDKALIINEEFDNVLGVTLLNISEYEMFTYIRALVEAAAEKEHKNW